MFAVIHLLATFIADLFKPRRRLEVENLFLRHQPLRRAPQRVRFRAGDRLCGALSYAVLGPVSLDDRTSQCTQKKPNVSLELSCDWISGRRFCVKLFAPVEAPPNQEFVTQNTVHRQTRACTSRERNLWHPGV